MPGYTGGDASGNRSRRLGPHWPRADASWWYTGKAGRIPPVPKPTRLVGKAQPRKEKGSSPPRPSRPAVAPGGTDEVERASYWVKWTQRPIQQTRKASQVNPWRRSRAKPLLTILRNRALRERTIRATPAVVSTVIHGGGSGTTLTSTVPRSV